MNPGTGKPEHGADGPGDRERSLVEAEVEAADIEPVAANQKVFAGRAGRVVAALCIGYAAFHIAVMNVYPLETWTYRLIHVAGGLFLGFLLFAAQTIDREAPGARVRGAADRALLGLAAAGILYGFACTAIAWIAREALGAAPPPPVLFASYGPPLLVGTLAALAHGWVFPDRRDARVNPADLLLGLSAVAVCLYIIFNVGPLRLRAGTALATPGDMWAALTGVILILELTRRLAGLALVVIVGVFVAYSFVGPWLPGFLEHRGYGAKRFFTYVYTDQGILGPTTAISSTYIVLFVTFAAFLQASRVGEYFVNFAFAAAGHARGGPAKVAVFASGLMGMINGTSAGNVVSTGSLTIPLMMKVGYRPQTAAAVEAAASSGGQIMPPIMGAGAFIMAEITGIPYREIVFAALIPAVLYFASVYFMVDLAATKTGMRGLPRRELPKFGRLARRAYLFLPIAVLIYALFSGYSVIRAGTLAMAAAAVVSWLTPHRMGPREVLYALEIAARMVLQLVAVCAAAGIIVGVIALTGVGTRFSAVLLALANQSQLVALVFAMGIAIVLGMGMPTTAAYAVAASVLAPGLIDLGIQPLVAHFFIFYFAVMSAITPPVALAAYAGAALARSDPMRTSVESFRIGLAAFVVPFMFFYSEAMLMQGTWLEVAHVFATAALGIYLLAAAVQNWFMGPLNLATRALLFAAALAMIKGGWASDLVGLLVAGGLALLQRRTAGAGAVARGRD
jgi:TRAP transporter 4TM/12TM fusion protein